MERSEAMPSKLFSGPRNLGRRKYDQARWWIGAVKDVGFPIFAFWLVWPGFNCLNKEPYTCR